jgi:hypothetical protein
MPSNPFKKVQVLQNYVTGHTVQWALDPLFTGTAPYTFTLEVYQDNTLQTPILTIDAGNNFFAVDDSKTRQNVLNSYMYRVKLVTDDDNTFYSDFRGWAPSRKVETRKYLLANEIARKEWLRYRMSGLYGYLLKRKYYAPAATAELDPVTGEPLTDTSAGSYGVGMTGGYYDPVLLKYTLEERNTELGLAQDGKGTSYQEIIKIRMSAFPMVEPNDILVNEEGNRYNVTKQNEIFFPGTMISLVQDITAQIIPPTDSVYDMTIPNFPDD